MTYFAVWSKRSGEVGFIVLFAGLLAATIAMAPPGNVNVYWLAPLWLIMLLISLYVFFFTVFEIKISPDSITIRSLIFRKTLTRNDIAHVDISIAAKSSQISIFDDSGRERIILLKSFENPESLASDVRQWWDKGRNVDSDTFLTTTFRAKGFAQLSLCFTIFLGFPLIGIPIFVESARPMLYIAVPMLGLFVWLIAAAFGSFVTISPGGLIVKRLGKEKGVAWESITRVRLGNRTTKGSTQETVTVYWDGHSVYLSSMFDHLPRIRDLILTHVSPSLVTDERRTL